MREAASDFLEILQKVRLRSASDGGRYTVVLWDGV